MAFWDNWPTWVKIAVPATVVGAGALLFLGRRSGDEGGEGEGEGGAVLPLITPSTGPSFPAGAFGGGSDYAPVSAGGGPSGTGADPFAEPPGGGGSMGGGGVGGQDVPPAAAPKPEDYAPPAPPGPAPLGSGQRRQISERIGRANDSAMRRKVQIEESRRRRNQAIMAELDANIARINGMNIGDGQKRLRRAAARAAAEAKKAASNTQAAGAQAASDAQLARVTAAARAMFGAGRT